MNLNRIINLNGFNREMENMYSQMNIGEQKKLWNFILMHLIYFEL